MWESVFRNEKSSYILILLKRALFMYDFGSLRRLRTGEYPASSCTSSLFSERVFGCYQESATLTINFTKQNFIFFTIFYEFFDESK